MRLFVESCVNQQNIPNKKLRRKEKIVEMELVSCITKYNKEEISLIVSKILLTKLLHYTYLFS